MLVNITCPCLVSDVHAINHDKKLNSKTGITPPEFHGPICSYFSVSSNHSVKDSCVVLILGSDENIDQ